MPLLPILSKFFAPSQNIKSQWWAQREAQLKQEFAPLEATLRHELETRVKTLESQTAALQAQERSYQLRQEELAALSHRADDRREELERANEDLREQVRLIEAKASPDRVWIEAVTTGYRLAWETMFPLMSEGLQKTKERIRDEAINTTIQNLEPVIAQRLVAAGKAELKTADVLLTKLDLFRKKHAAAKTDEDKQKYDAYITCLNWALNGDRPRSH